MYLPLRIFCIIICLSMIFYKSYGVYTHFHAIQPRSQSRKPILIYLNKQINIDEDEKLTKLVESLPLKYFFYSSFSSFGVILIPKMISVFWRVWHLIPQLINGQDSKSVLAIHQKIILTIIAFMHSLLIMYIVVK